jgi:hypothetical protein
MADKFKATIMAVENLDNKYRIVANIKKPYIPPLAEEQKTDKKAVEQYNTKIEAAEDFMASLGLGNIEFEYLD